MKTIVLDIQNTTELEVTEDCEILALFLGSSDESLRNKIRIVHRKPGITSRVDIRAVLQDRSSFDLETTVVIEDGAYLSDTYLNMRALLLSDLAKAKSVPSLEIKEDQVKGGHAASIGKLDSDQMHYLKTRGLTDKEAEDLLVHAFIQDITEKIHAAS